MKLKRKKVKKLNGFYSRPDLQISAHLLAALMIGVEHIYKMGYGDQEIAIGWGCNLKIAPSEE